MLLRCYIIDDDSVSIRILSEYIDHHSQMVLVGYNHNPIIGLDEINKILPDVVFLGINQSVIKGLELSSLINQSIYKVFITPLPDFALVAFDHNAFDYLLKPVTTERFLKAANKLSSHFKKSIAIEKDQLSFIYVKCENKGKLVKIEFDEIYYIESNDNFIILNLFDTKYNVYMPLKEVINKLPATNFIRIHKSFIVNHSKISYIDGAQIVLKDKTQLQLGTTYRDHFLRYIEKFTLKHTPQPSLKFERFR